MICLIDDHQYDGIIILTLLMMMVMLDDGGDDKILSYMHLDRTSQIEVGLNCTRRNSRS